jgi:hypothetical protein
VQILLPDIYCKHNRNHDMMSLLTVELFSLCCILRLYHESVILYTFAAKSSSPESRSSLNKNPTIPVFSSIHTSSLSTSTNAKQRIQQSHCSTALPPQSSPPIYYPFFSLHQSPPLPSSRCSARIFRTRFQHAS